MPTFGEREEAGSFQETATRRTAPSHQSVSPTARRPRRLLWEKLWDMSFKLLKTSPKAFISKVEKFKGARIMVPMVIIALGIAIVSSMLLETG